MLHMRSIGAFTRFAGLLVLTLVFAGTSEAQSLNWEGQTGGLTTPFATTAPSPDGGIGHPAVGFHVLNAGGVVGTHMQLSATVGLLKRLEVGFTRSAVSVGAGDISSLFDRGFSNVHAKVNLVRAHEGNRSWPAISAGFIVRFQSRHLREDVVQAAATRNGDVFVVATKELRATETLSILASGGLKVTNATLMGMAGNAPGWKPRGFGACGALLGGLVLLGGEVLQQSPDIDGLPGAALPTTVTYFARILAPTKVPFTIDVALVRAAGIVAPGVDLDARNRFAVGGSVRF